jgi:hypothetical protein
MFFSPKNNLIPNVAEKYSHFGGAKTSFALRARK